MKVSTRKLEMRIITSSLLAGVSEVLLRLTTGVQFFGYLGVGLMLYGACHYALLIHDEKKVMNDG